jgi:hypothetical protein
MTGLKITDLAYILPQDITGDDVIPIVDITMDSLRQMRVSDLRTNFLNGVTVSTNFSSITNKPTTLGGYGITDAYTINQIDTILQAYSPNIAYAGATSDGMLSSVNWVTFNNKQPALVSGTNIATINSQSLLNGGNINVSTDISGKQDTLVSGTNIKSINGTSLLGSGDITISSGASISKTPFTATEGQADFVCTGLTLSSPMVYLNGVVQNLTDTYTYSGSTVTFNVVRVLNDKVLVVN